MSRDGKGKRPAMTDEQIETQLAERKETRLYGSRADRASMWRQVNDEQLSKLLDLSFMGLRNIADGTVKISLADTETVQQYTLRYWQLCTENSVIPYFETLMAALGYTKKGGYDFMSRHPDHPTTAWLRSVQDHINGVVSNGAMTGALAPIPAIFYMKCHGLREDTNDMPDDRSGTDGESAETIMERYKDLPDV